jgi:hypothetical protein
MVSRFWVVTPQYKAALLAFLPCVRGNLVTSHLAHNSQTTSIELLDPENMGVAVGISFLSHLQAEI